jgi:hypothetical protein
MSDYNDLDEEVRRLFADATNAANPSISLGSSGGPRSYRRARKRAVTRWRQ